MLQHKRHFFARLSIASLVLCFTLGWRGFNASADEPEASTPAAKAIADHPHADKKDGHSASSGGEKHPEHAAAPKADKSHGDDLDLSHSNATPALGSPAQLKSDLAIYTFIVFGLLLVVLWKFAWGPILEGLTKREQGISNQIDEANRTAAEAKAMLGQYQSQLSQAQAEVRKMLEEGRRDGEATANRIVNDAHEAAKRERDSALQQIEAAKTSALRELAEHSVNTAVSLAGQIVSRQLTPQDHQKLVRDALNQFPSKN